MEETQPQAPRWPLAIIFGVGVGLFLFFMVGGWAWKAENELGIWPVAGVDGWFKFLWALHKSPRGTLSSLHTNFQFRFYLPLIISVCTGVSLAIWSARSQLGVAADHHVRGRRYLTGRAALIAFTRESARECKVDGAGIRLHPSLPPLGLKREPRHFLFFGGVGSGKTQSIVPLMLAAQERGDCLLVYDNKGDFTAKLPGRIITTGKGKDAVHRSIPPIILAPWDTRSAPWEIAADVADKSAAREFAAAIVPESQSAPMWSAAARQVLTGCIVQLQATMPGAWGFVDLAKLVFRGDPEEHKVTMKDHFPEGLVAVSGAAVTTLGIMINMTSFLSPVADLADAWPTAPAPGKGFSLRRWLTNERPVQRTVLIQGNGRFESLAQAFAKALFTLAAQTITDPAAIGESKTRRLWVFLDEFPQLGELNRVAPLLEVGRSKGVRVVLGVQDISQLKAIYGHDRAAAWQSLVANQVVCQLQPGATSKFVAEEIIGERELERVSSSKTTGSGAQPGLFSPGGTRTTSTVRETRPVLLPSQLQSSLGPRAGGVDVLWLGFGDAIKLTIPYTTLQDARPAVKIADWTFRPSTREALAMMAAQVQEATTTPAAPPTPTPLPAEAEAPPVAPLASDPDDTLSFLDEDRDDDEEGEQIAGLPAVALPLEVGAPAIRDRLVDEIADPEAPIVIPKHNLVADVVKNEAGEDSIKDKLASAGSAALVDSVVPGLGHLLEIADVASDAAQTVAGPAADIIPQPPQRRKLKRRASLEPDQSQDPSC